LTIQAHHSQLNDYSPHLGGQHHGGDTNGG
jgi:hypothetical protein